MTQQEIKASLLKDGESQYTKDHLNRLSQSIQFLQEHLPFETKRYYFCIDTGGSANFVRTLEQCSNISIAHHSTMWDLRYPFPVSDKQYDLALSMEVFEHIKDRDSDEKEWVAAWTYTGVLNYLCEMNRILKDGGYLFMTTPNFATIRTFYRLLGHDCPLFFNQHVREYTINELKSLLEITGFSVEICTTKNVWGEDDIHPGIKEKIIKFCSENGYNTTNRGDDIFLLAKKVSDPREILFKSDYFTITKSYLFEKQFQTKNLK